MYFLPEIIRFIRVDDELATLVGLILRIFRLNWVKRLCSLDPKVVFIWKRACPLSRAGPFCRDLASLWNPCKICLRLHERRASGPKRDLAIDDPRSRLGGLEIFQINTEKGWPSYYACMLDPALLEGPENFHIKARWNSALLLGLALPRGLARLHINIL